MPEETPRLKALRDRVNRLSDFRFAILHAALATLRPVSSRDLEACSSYEAAQAREKELLDSRAEFLRNSTPPDLLELIREAIREAYRFTMFNIELKQEPPEDCFHGMPWTQQNDILRYANKNVGSPFLWPIPASREVEALHLRWVSDVERNDGKPIDEPGFTGADPEPDPSPPSAPSAPA